MLSTRIRHSYLGSFLAGTLAATVTPAAWSQTTATSVLTPLPHWPQEDAIAAAPRPYREEIVGFDNPAAPSVHLEGTLTLPEGRGPFAGAILIAGTGRNDRDETTRNTGHKPMLVLADLLTRHGYAVLRYDKRGVGKSSGDYDAATRPDFVSDAQAALAYLRSRPEIDRTRTGPIGHSEGAIISGLIAADDPSIDFCVMLAGSAGSESDLVTEQTRLIDIANGKAPELAAQEYRWNKVLFAAIGASKDRADAEARIRAFVAATDPPPNKAVIDQAMHYARLGYMRYILSDDPTPSLVKIRVPVLALAGTKDLLVPPSHSVPALRQAFARHPDATVVEMPGLNHFFQHAVTGSPAELATIKETLAPEVGEVLIPWLARHTIASSH